MTLIYSLIAQFGDGFSPPDQDGYNPRTVTNDSIINTLVKFLSNLIGVITVLGGLFFIVYFFLGAFEWITSGGDSGKVEQARNKILHATLGLIVMVVAYSVIGIIGKLIGLDLINLRETVLEVVPE